MKKEIIMQISMAHSKLSCKNKTFSCAELFSHALDIVVDKTVQVFHVMRHAAVDRYAMKHLISSSMSAMVHQRLRLLPITLGQERQVE
jgi:hypothetical protein